MIIALALMVGFFLGSVMTFAGLLFFAIVTGLADADETPRNRSLFASSGDVDDLGNSSPIFAGNSRLNSTSTSESVTYH